MDEERHRRGPLVEGSLEAISVPPNGSILDAVRAMQGALGHGLPKTLALVVNQGGHLEGVVTDGDLRAAMLAGRSNESPVADIMTTTPVTVRADLDPEAWLAEVRRQITDSGRNRSIRYAVLVDAERRPLALVDVDRLLFTEDATIGRVAVIGLGYVGLTLAVALGERGISVAGFDVRESVRKGLRDGVSHVHEASIEPALAAQIGDGRLEIVDEVADLADCGVYVICVNTPVNDSEPDLGDITKAVAELAPVLRPSDVVVLRSTVPVGTCSGLVKRVIEETTGLRAGTDVGIAFAPERTVAGNALEELHTLPQVIAGINLRSTLVTEQVFGALSPMIIRLDHLEEAELVKLINNTFRDVSFAFANEVALICTELNLSARRVISAANAGYPRNPISLPSPGVGGPCLPKDSFLFASAERDATLPSLAVAARAINERLPELAARRIVASLEELGGDPGAASVLVLGLAFKGEPETNDVRGSPSLSLIAALAPHVGRIVGWDAVLTREEARATGVDWHDLPTVGFGGIDAVAVMNNHRRFLAIDTTRMLAELNRPAVVFDGFGMLESLERRRVADVRYLDVSWSAPILQS